MEKYPGLCNQDIALRVYSSRLIGRESSLVLHGGGNTSVKTTLQDDLGDQVKVLCVKGSGWDLATLDVPGLPAVRLDSFAALRGRDRLSDEAMVNAARTRLLDSRAPNPSVEALLHAFLPHRFIDHSHADSILSLVDQEHAEVICKRIYGDRLAIVPYVMPGFELAKLAARCHENHPRASGLLLLQHGLFTYGETARSSYELHIEMVSLAEQYIASKKGALRGASSRRVVESPPPRYEHFAPVLRGALRSGLVFDLRTSALIRAFVDDPELGRLAGQGPATPDHVIRTKSRPLILGLLDDKEALDGAEGWVSQIHDAVREYHRDYECYFSRQVMDRGLERVALDPDPRVVLVPGLGLIGLGPDPQSARTAADLYEHTISVIVDAEAVGSYRPLPESDLFDMEYWPLEQAKLGTKSHRALEGQVVLITGAGSGIGEATARLFSTHGACLCLVDIDGQKVASVAESLDCPWEAVDLCDSSALHRSVDRCVCHYGGLDGVVSNAGRAPQSAMDQCPQALFDQSLQINLIAHQELAASASRVMKRQGKGGFLLFNASKAAFNPGPNFGPYAVAKAGLVALMKQYALEGGAAGIRSNAVNADRVQTGLLPREMLEARARARGLKTEDYFRANLLSVRVRAEDVAGAFLHLALAPSTTGGVLTVDGGNIAASPR